MNIRFFTILSLALLNISFITAQTIIPGGYVSGTWTSTASSYLIQGNITIHADSTLTIEPGVDVEFQGFLILTVNGYLEAIGTGTDSIRFSASTTWQGITFNNAPDSSHLAYCSITGCQNGIAAGIYCINSNPVFTHCTVRNNSGIFYGGIALDNSNPLISYCIVSNNKGYFNYGSGISTLNSSPEISFCSITGNGHANSYGTIYCGYGSTALISHCSITGNEGIRGGGVFVDAGGNPVISNCTISENIAFSGGGIYFSNGGHGTITDCTLNADSTINDPNANGGGIFISSPNAVIQINNSTFSNCWSAQGGSAIHIEDADSVSITGSTFEGNLCPGSIIELGAIYSANCTNLVIDHCNFVNNRSFWFSGGITLNGITNLTLTNSIFMNQIENDIVFVSYSSASVSYCDFYGSSWQPFHFPPAGLGTLVQTNSNGDSCDVFNNIYLDPLFMDFANGNYHLTEDSPCIDAGDPTSPYDPDGTVTDMGVFYFPAQTMQALDIAAGWSGISSYLNPLNPDIEDLLSPILNELIIIYTDDGMYWPQGGITTLHNWDSENGYIIKTDAPVMLSVEGAFLSNTTLSLYAGWNILPVLTNCEIPVEQIYNSLGDNLVIICEIAGTDLFWPELGVNTLQNIVHGKAYSIYILTDTTYTFPSCE